MHQPIQFSTSVHNKQKQMKISACPTKTNEDQWFWLLLVLYLMVVRTQPPGCRPRRRPLPNLLAAGAAATSQAAGAPISSWSRHQSPTTLCSYWLQPPPCFPSPPALVYQQTTYTHSRRSPVWPTSSAAASLMSISSATTTNPTCPPFTAATPDRSTTQCQAVRCRSSGGAHLNLSTPPPGCSCSSGIYSVHIVAMVILLWFSAHLVWFLSSVPSGKFVLQHMVSLSCTCLYCPSSPAPQAALLSCACCSTGICLNA